MRKCTSFPSLVVLKHIHMSSMFPFLLLPLALSPFLFLSLSSSSYFPSVKNSCGAQTDDMTHWSGVFLLLSCCWLSRLTVWQIQFGVLECAEAISTGPELSVVLCANIGSRSLSTSQRVEHTHNSGEAFYRVWAAFFISFALCLSLSLSLSSSLSLFLLPQCLRKLICFKTRAKYYHIYIFLFQEGNKVRVCGVDFSFLFFLLGGSWKVSVWGWALFETLNLFHAYLFYDSTGHRVYTKSATSGLDNLLRINKAQMLISFIWLPFLCFSSALMVFQPLTDICFLLLLNVFQENRD